MTQAFSMKIFETIIDKRCVYGSMKSILLCCAVLYTSLCVTCKHLLCSVCSVPCLCFLATWFVAHKGRVQYEVPPTPCFSRLTRL